VAQFNADLPDRGLPPAAGLRLGAIAHPNSSLATTARVTTSSQLAPWFNSIFRHLIP